MAGQIDANYASPGLRWGLLLEDHPGATYEFAYSKGSDIPKVGIPAEYGGDRAVCVATIAFPLASGLAPVVAYKPIAAEGAPDEWNILCTKTLGRALKKAGYPDNLVDLKALVLWRQRNAEVEAITASVGVAPLQLGRGEDVVKALEEAATNDTPDGRGGGDDDGDANVAPHPETLSALREAFGDLSKAQQKDATERAAARDTDLLNPTDEEQAQRIVAWLRHLAEGGGDDATVTAEVVDDDEAPPDGVDAETGEVTEDQDDVATVAELIVGLDRNAKKLFDGYCKTIGAPTDPTKMTPDHLFAVLEWFASDDDDEAVSA